MINIQREILQELIDYFQTTVGKENILLHHINTNPSESILTLQLKNAKITNALFTLLGREGFNVRFGVSPLPRRQI